MKRRLLAAILTACLLLPGCGVQRTEPTEEVPAENGPLLAYVPLDDRPDNEERVLYLAQSVGYTVAMPERDRYRTRLDGQPLNENGTQYGDRSALYEWVLEQEAAGCDRYILSLDQLLSGGLVNSRHMESSLPVTLSDGTELSEAEVLSRLLAALAADPDNRVWLLDTVMRLAPTSGYNGFGLEEYNALRAYGMEERPTLSGAELTVENIAADYALSADGSVIAPEEKYSLPENAVENYLASRERKLRLSDETERILSGAGYENFRLLIGIDDSSSEDSIQKNEIAYLRAGLLKDKFGKATDFLLSGVDDLAFKAVSKLYLEESGWQGAKVAVRYYGGTEDHPACAYDSQPLTEIVAEHLDFFDLREMTQAGSAPELEILILTQSADAEHAQDYKNLIQRLNGNAEANRPTILIDAGNGTYQTAFHEALTRETELGRLLSYAGFLDMAIVTGTALSHGVARYAYLQSGENEPAANRAFQRTLADSILKDFCYKNVVREELLSFVRNDLGGNADNFWNPEIDREQVRLRLENDMADATQPVLENLERSNLIVSLKPYGEVGWGGIELTHYRFPWDRAFEIGMDLSLGEVTQPHKKLLGIYIQ